MEYEYEVLDSEWRSGRDTVGIILTRTRGGKLRAYIGVGSGIDEEGDAQIIAAHGMRIPFREAVGFFPKIEEGDYES